MRFLKTFPDAVVAAAIALVISASAAAAPAKRQPAWRKITLTTEFFSEGACIGDFNNDGVPDIAAGPFWFAGPDFKQRRLVHEPKAFDMKKHPYIYSDNFSQFAYDFNGDGWQDILVCAHPGTRGYWFENPGKTAAAGAVAGDPAGGATGGAAPLWKKHFFPNEIGNESPQFLRLAKTDVHPSLLYNRNGYLGFSTLAVTGGAPQWTFHNVSGKKNTRRYQRYTHGVGAGDINGDGRADIIENEGWWEAPAASAAGNGVGSGERGTGSGEKSAGTVSEKTAWKYHPYVAAPEAAAGDAGNAAAAGSTNTGAAAAGDAAKKRKRLPPRFAVAGSHMLVFDVNGDGLNDVVTAWHCHTYGLVWHEQVRVDAKTAAGGETIRWRRHEILPVEPDLKSPALRFSQMHALAAADLNGDGLPDLVTGKRFWAHGPDGDKEPSAPCVLYWFELVRDKTAPGGARFVPHKIDDDSGVSTQLTLGDLNGDGVPDILVSSKKGIHVFLSR